MAAARAVVEGRKAVFLLPYRALVNEKYEQFDALYGAAGMRVIRCTGDYSDQTETNLRQPSQSSKLLMSPMTAESTMSCGAMPRSRAVMRSVSSNSTLMPLPGSVTNWASSRTMSPNWLRTTAGFPTVKLRNISALYERSCCRRTQPGASHLCCVDLRHAI